LEVRKLIAEQREKSLNKLQEIYGKIVEVHDKDTNKVDTYLSIYKASARYGISRSTIRNYIASGKLYKNRYSFKFSEYIN
jgi:hypothetical protein